MHQKLLLFFFFGCDFFFCYCCLYENTQNDATKREKIKIKQPSALFSFKASHHLLIKERLSKPASADHSSLQGNPREELAWIALKTNKANTIQENLKNVYGIMSLSVVVHSTGRTHTQHTALLHN